MGLPIDSPPSHGTGSRLLRWYRPSPAAPAIADTDTARRAMLHWRLRMFAGFFLGYALLYFCRKNISSALPAMARDLGTTNLALGAIGTSLYVTYGLGKFLNGVLADRSNIRVFMATGLILSGVLNLVFGSVTSLWLMAVVWGLNGWFQSMGFPPIARGMTLWFPAKGKATRWAFWTCSHQAGTAAVMALTTWTLTWASWRVAFWLPGVVCIVFGGVLLLLLADTPESKGLPATGAIRDTTGGRDDRAEYRTLFLRHVLFNRNVWAIGCIDLCVYVVRFGTLDWTTKYLIEVKHYAQVSAGFRASIMPVAGVVGVLVSGLLADVAFKGRYRAVNALSLGALALCLFVLHRLGPGHPWLDVLMLAGVGFFVEGPQSILGGVGAVDAGGSARVASSAAGLVGVLSYVGASLSGAGTGFFIDRTGWSGAFAFWTACALLGLALCVFVWKEPRATSSPDALPRSPSNDSRR